MLIGTTAVTVGMTQPGDAVGSAAMSLTASSQRILRGLSHEAFGSTAVAPGEVTYSLYEVVNSTLVSGAGAEE